jgi:23S rRNA (cytosine1962-C5)-methyltransferase
VRFPDKRQQLDQRLRAATERRRALARESHTSAYRLVSSGGDALPGLEIDVYGEHLVVSLTGEEALAGREMILDALAERHPGGIYLKLRPKTANTLIDTRREEVAPPKPVRGPAAPDPLVIVEHDIAYEVRLGDGLSTGIFLDQREARLQVRKISRGARVANLFCYHAAFTIAAIAGGAEQSVSIDSSQAALDGAERNLLRHDACREAHRLVKSDARSWLERQAKNAQDERFDLIVLDPPSFSSTKRGTFRVVRDYPGLLEDALRCLAPNGHLLACCNLRSLSLRSFQDKICATVEGAGWRIESLSALAVPEDFLPTPGEEHYQKNLLLRLARTAT